jgi:hypothetical protein
MTDGITFDNMWTDSIFDNPNPGTTLGGDLKTLTNFCCVKLTHALREGGHTITEKSDFKDTNGKGYIIRCVTMEKYLNGKFGTGVKVTKSGVNEKKGILFFKDCGFTDATGHFTLIKDGKLRKPEKDNYWERAKSVLFWEF